MRKIVLTFAFMLISGILSAQYYHHSDYKYIKIKGGINYPLKPSKYIEYENVNFSSFLELGFYEGLEFGYYFTENIGICASILSNQNSVDGNLYAQEFLSANQSVSSVSIGQFINCSIYFGMVFNIPISEFVSIIPKMMLGSFMVWKPAGEIQYFDQGSLRPYSEKQILGSSFSPLLGVETKIKLIDNLSLYVDAEYQTGNFEFSKREKKQQIKMIMLSIGLSYNFL